MFLRTILFTIMALMSSVLSMQADFMAQPLTTEDKSLCDTADACTNLDNKDCLCFCAQKVGPREKMADDMPVYYADDAAENYCYCKQADYEEAQEALAGNGNNADEMDLETASIW